MSVLVNKMLVMHFPLIFSQTIRVTRKTCKLLIVNGFCFRILQRTIMKFQHILSANRSKLTKICHRIVVGTNDTREIKVPSD